MLGSPALLWSIVGVASLGAIVGAVFLIRLFGRHAFDSKVRALFESGQHEMAVAKLTEKGRQREAAEMLVRWGKLDRAAQVYVQLDEWIRAAELYENARQFGTAAVYFLKAGETERASECYRRHGQADKAAEILRRLGRDKDAIELLKKAGEFGRAAAIEREQGSLDQAVETLKQGNRFVEAAAMLKEHGEDRSATELLARHHDLANEWEAAARQYEELGDVEGAAERYARAGLGLRAGELYERLGRTAEAVAQFQQAKAYDRAAAGFEKLQDHREAARHYLLAGLLNKAVENLHRAGDVISVAQLYHRSGYGPQALAVLNVEPDHPQYKDAHLTRARLLEHGGDLDGARNDLVGLVTQLGLSFESLDVVYRIAELHIQQGDPENALRTLERVRQRGVAHPELSRRITRLREVVDRAAAEAAASAASAAAARPVRELNITVALPQHERYEFLRKIGQGGMGAVYKAQDRRLGRVVALKLLAQSDLPSDMAKKYFFREAQTVSVLNHPNIVTIYDFGEIDGCPYIAMEFIDGRNLEQMVTGGATTLPLPKVVRYCSQLASALDYAHQKKVVHRDIKLGNVMVTNEEVVKLMDFGLAKAITENPDRSLLVIGTPYYMAPEQIAHEDIDHRVDVYSLGILLFRLCTGRLPFETGDVLRSQRFDAPPDPSIYQPSLPKHLCGLILHCMEKRAEDRPQRASEVAERLLALAL